MEGFTAAAAALFDDAKEGVGVDVREVEVDGAEEEEEEEKVPAALLPLVVVVVVVVVDAPDIVIS